MSYLWSVDSWQLIRTRNARIHNPAAVTEWVSDAVPISCSLPAARRKVRRKSCVQACLNVLQCSLRVHLYTRVNGCGSLSQWTILQNVWVFYLFGKWKINVTFRKENMVCLTNNVLLVSLRQYTVKWDVPRKSNYARGRTQTTFRREINREGLRLELLFLVLKRGTNIAVCRAL